MSQSVDNSREFRRTRSELDKSVLKAASVAARGRRWRKSRECLVWQEGDFFTASRISIPLNRFGTELTFIAKPMLADRVLWDILGMPKNSEQPLSFRALGAFTCDSPPLASTVIDDRELAPLELAEAWVSWADDTLAASKSALTEAAFVERLASHGNQRKRGAYAISLCCALIVAGNIAEARKLCDLHCSGRATTTSNFSSGGRDFFELALEWMDTSRKRTLH